MYQQQMGYGQHAGYRQQAAAYGRQARSLERFVTPLRVIAHICHAVGGCLCLCCARKNLFILNLLFPINTLTYTHTHTHFHVVFVFCRSLRLKPMMGNILLQNVHV